MAAEKAAGKNIALLCVFLPLLWAGGASAGVETVYFAKDGVFHLKLPIKPPAPITAIIWKLKGDIVAELRESGSVVYYRTFKDRAVLDTKTAQLTIHKALPEFSGEYKVEINNVDVTSVSWEAVLLSRLRVPLVELKPLACDDTSTECSLSCEGATKENGPVTYQWRRDSGPWEDGAITLNITKKSDLGVGEFQCRMKSPVDEMESAAFGNPFKTPVNLGVAVGVPVTLTLLVLGGVAGWCFKSGKYQEYVPAKGN